jgi:hypothetical protein
VAAVVSRPSILPVFSSACLRHVWTHAVNKTALLLVLVGLSLCGCTRTTVSDKSHEDSDVQSMPLSDYPDIENTIRLSRVISHLNSHFATPAFDKAEVYLTNGTPTFVVVPLTNAPEGLLVPLKDGIVPVDGIVLSVVSPQDGSSDGEVSFSEPLTGKPLLIASYTDGEIHSVSEPGLVQEGLSPAGVNWTTFKACALTVTLHLASANTAYAHACRLAFRGCLQRGCKPCCEVLAICAAAALGTCLFVAYSFSP